MLKNRDKSDVENQDGTRVPEISNDQDSSVDGRLYNIESDRDTLEPQAFGATTERIDVDDPKALAYWAEQFQVSSEELKAAAVMTGNTVSGIKEYLSV